MRSSIFTTRLLVALALVAGGAAVPACTDGSQIAQSPSAKTGKGKGDSAKPSGSDATGSDGGSGLSASGDANITSDSDIQSAGGAGGSIGSKGDTGAPAAPVVYPVLALAGSGVTTCQGDFYPTNAAFSSTMDDTKLVLNLTAATINSDSDKVNKKANEKISQNLGETVYTRVTAAQRDQLKAQGFDYADYAIFATSVTKQRQGQSFTFDKPLPVFPWPAPASRYDSLVAAGQKSWSANVTGSINAHVTVTIQKVGGDEKTQIIKFTTTIDGDTNRALYEQFPLSREQTFTVSSDTKDVRQIDQLSWFLGQDNCDGGQEQITMTYKLCQKTVSGQTNTFPCQ